MDEKRGIGLAGKLPWRLPADLKRFRRLTMGHHIIMGRKTFESIGKPLPGRTTVVVTRDRQFRAEGCDVSHSVEAALELARKRGESESFVCGGAEIYAAALRLADRIYLTRVRAEVRADTFFPEFDEREWIEQESEYHPADEENQYPFTFKVYEKLKIENS
jgi:dihydrofolate reductase